jgi:hypothetical protein
VVILRIQTIKRFAERVRERTRPDYDRVMMLVANVVTKQGDKIGDRHIRSINPRAADKIYERIIDGPKGKRLRQDEKVIPLCRHAWKVVHRLYPEQFDRDVPNPWTGVTNKRRTMKTKKKRRRVIRAPGIDHGSSSDVQSIRSANLRMIR